MARDVDLDGLNRMLKRAGPALGKRDREIRGSVEQAIGTEYARRDAAALRERTPYFWHGDRLCIDTAKGPIALAAAGEFPTLVRIGQLRERQAQRRQAG